MNIAIIGSNKNNLSTIIADYLDNINSTYIRRVPFYSVPKGDGMYGGDIIFQFSENYYQKYDVMVIENSRQQVIFTQRPVRKNNIWEIVGKLHGSIFLDILACQPGMLTRFVANYLPPITSNINYDFRDEYTVNHFLINELPNSNENWRIFAKSLNNLGINNIILINCSEMIPSIFLNNFKVIIVDSPSYYQTSLEISESARKIINQQIIPSLYG